MFIAAAQWQLQTGSQNTTESVIGKWVLGQNTNVNIEMSCGLQIFAFEMRISKYIPARLLSSVIHLHLATLHIQNFNYHSILK